MKQKNLYKRACNLLGVNPEKVRLVGPTEWKEIVGKGVGNNLGKCSRRNNVVYVRRNQGFDTYIHELLHILFPSKKHSWIYGAAYKLAGVNVGHKIYGKIQSPDNCPESTVKVVSLANKSAKRRKLN